jgi:hypothetical protein
VSLVDHWYSQRRRFSPSHWPLSMLFGAAVALRRAL